MPHSAKSISIIDMIEIDCEQSPLFLQEIVENRASRDERAREKWGEDKKIAPLFARSLISRRSILGDLLEEKRRLLAVYDINKNNFN